MPMPRTARSPDSPRSSRLLSTPLLSSLALSSVGPPPESCTAQCRALHRSTIFWLGDEEEEKKAGTLCNIITIGGEGEKDGEGRQSARTDRTAPLEESYEAITRAGQSSEPRA